jgi:hypothetical protein
MPTETPVIRGTILAGSPRAHGVMPRAINALRDSACDTHNQIKSDSMYS